MVRLLAVAASAILCKNGGASRAPTAHISVPVGFDGPGEQDSLVEVNASLGQPYLGTSVTRSTNLRDQLNPTLLASLRNIGLSDAQISGMLQQGLLATDVTPSADEGGAVMDPTDYTEAEEALDRCRASNTRRLVKVAAITPLMLVATELVFFHGVGMELVASTFDAVARETAIPIANALSSFGSSIFTTATISIAGLEGSLFFTTLALHTILRLMAAVYIVGGAIIAITPAAASILVPIVVAMRGAELVTSSSVDLGAALLYGSGDQYPRCCCPVTALDAEGVNGMACAAVTHTTMTDSVCPPDWEHHPDACSVPEVMMYDQESTVAGCTCMNSTDCGSNDLHRGHAWCDVAGPGRCGRRYRASRSRRWDFCQFDGRPLDYAQGRSNDTMDALSSFVPNTFRNRFLFAAPGDLVGLGTWVDSGRALVTAKRSFFATRQCFVSTPMETLGACAKSCLTDGTHDSFLAPGNQNAERPCVAFAYNRRAHACVHLPDFAVSAELTPHLESFDGDGWQHFVHKYTNTARRTVCRPDVIDEISQAGYPVVRDMNDGHLEVTCTNAERVQKVSCIPSECRTGSQSSSWCFVQNGCSSCSRISDLESLQCTGQFGVMIPSDIPEMSVQYWDSVASLQRCEDANHVRRVRRAVAMPAMFILGDAALVSFFTGGLLADIVSSTARLTHQPLVNFFHAGNTAIWNVATFNTGFRLVNAVLLITGAMFSVTWSVGGFFVALTPTVASFVGPIVAGMIGSERVTSFTADLALQFAGYGTSYPKCCCPPNQADAAEPMCALVHSESSNVCPPDWEHAPGNCAVPEVVRFSDEQTATGCACANYTDCGTNVPYHGHAWCDTTGPDGCGQRHGLSSRRWDYCKMDGAPLRFATGESTSTNDALASFVPNEYRSWSLLGPDNILRQGSWTNADRAVTTVEHGGMRRCFAAISVETLGACARMCLDDGAPSARAMVGVNENARYPCVAFAFHRSQHLCARLPSFAADARFTPTLPTWDGDGWQNFVSMYHGDSCSSEALLDVVARGYEVATNENDGHLWISCPGQETRQKASCIASECQDRDHPWCFVENECGGFGDTCTKMQNPRPLDCSS